MTLLGALILTAVSAVLLVGLAWVRWYFSTICRFQRIGRRNYYRDVIECIVDLRGDVHSVSRKQTNEYHGKGFLAQYAAELILKQYEERRRLEWLEMKSRT